MRSGILLLAAIIVALCGAPASRVRFVDTTAKAGIHFKHNSGATGQRYLPETLGAGCSFVDIDGDGWADIILINGKDFIPRGHRSLPAVYRNNRNGTFTDITRGSELDVEMYGMGIAVADYDNDGLPDVYITALEGDRLFHNEGHGHFRDVTHASGIRNSNFGTSAAWFDFDKDGKADLVVADYATWSSKTDLWP